jgi:hypothetical protein
VLCHLIGNDRGDRGSSCPAVGPQERCLYQACDEEARARDDFENWTSAKSGYAGKRFNTWDPHSGRWNQVHFSGSRRGNVMEMEGTDVDAEGTVHYRMSWTLNADGTVRQLWEASRDRAHWETIFDGHY